MSPWPFGVKLRSLVSFGVRPGLSFLCLGGLLFSNIALTFHRPPRWALWQLMFSGTIWHIIWPNRHPRGPCGRPPVNEYFVDAYAQAWREIYTHICSIICSNAATYAQQKNRQRRGNSLTKISILSHPCHLGFFVGRPPHGCLCCRRSSCLPISLAANSEFCWGPMSYRREAEYARFFCLAKW